MAARGPTGHPPYQHVLGLDPQFRGRCRGDLPKKARHRECHGFRGIENAVPEAAGHASQSLAAAAAARACGSVCERPVLAFLVDPWGFALNAKFGHNGRFRADPRLMLGFSSRRATSGTARSVYESAALSVRAAHQDDARSRRRTRGSAAARVRGCRPGRPGRIAHSRRSEGGRASSPDSLAASRARRGTSGRSGSRCPPVSRAGISRPRRATKWSARPRSAPRPRCVFWLLGMGRSHSGGSPSSASGFRAAHCALTACFSQRPSALVDRLLRISP